MRVNTVMRRGRIDLGVSVLAVGASLAVVTSHANAQSCSSPGTYTVPAPYYGVPTVDVDYTSGGKYYMLRNWMDWTAHPISDSAHYHDHLFGDGGTTLRTTITDTQHRWNYALNAIVSPDDTSHSYGLTTTVAGGDWFLFTYRPPGGADHCDFPVYDTPGPYYDNWPGVTAAQQPTVMSDPTVMRIGDWYYITGTCGAPTLPTHMGVDDAHSNTAEEMAILGTEEANFIIWRTKDFYHFEPHMFAFREQDLSTARAAWKYRDGKRLYVGTYGGVPVSYSFMQSPNLYTDGSYVYLSFTAIRNSVHAEDSAPAYDYEREMLDQTSVYTCVISACDFKAWHDVGWYRGDGTFFDDITLGGWNQYVDGGSTLHNDGGRSVSHRIGCSGDPNVLYSANEMGWNGSSSNYDPCGNSAVYGRGFSYWSTPTSGGTPGVLDDPGTFMSEGADIFEDPRATSSGTSSRPRWWWVYNYNDGARGAGNVDPYQDSSHKRGNAIAATGITNSDFPFRAWNDRDLIYVANAICTTSGTQIPVVPYGGGSPSTVNNGSLDRALRPWYWGGIAEASTAYYSPVSHRYYLLLSRNVWDGMPYQITYRMSAENAEFSSLDLGNRTTFASNEHVLLRNEYLDISGSPAGQLASCYADGTPWNYGSPDVFDFVDSAGGAHPMIAFAAKMNSSPRRTIFFKELTIDAETGLIHVIEDHADLGGGWGVDPNSATTSDHRYGANAFIVPAQIKSECSFIDLNHDGSIDLSDYFDFLTGFDESDPIADVDGNCSVDLNDYFLWLDAWDNCESDLTPYYLP